MNQKAREVVDETLKGLFPHGITSLYFVHEYTGFKLKTNPFKGLNLKDSIMECLNTMRYCQSYNENNQYETRQGANRSVIDVWRHLKYYNNDLTIFEVMNAVYELIYNEELINTFICSDIMRRVLITGESDSYISDSDIYDVFNLYLNEWNNI